MSWNWKVPRTAFFDRKTRTQLGSAPCRYSSFTWWEEPKKLDFVRGRDTPILKWGFFTQDGQRSDLPSSQVGSMVRDKHLHTLFKRGRDIPFSTFTFPAIYRYRAHVQTSKTIARGTSRPPSPTYCGWQMWPGQDPKSGLALSLYIFIWDYYKPNGELEVWFINSKMSKKVSWK